MEGGKTTTLSPFSPFSLYGRRNEDSNGSYIELHLSKYAFFFFFQICGQFLWISRSKQPTPFLLFHLSTFKKTSVGCKEESQN